MLDVDQLKNDVIVPTLREMVLYTPAGVELLLGIAAHESRLGTYLKQVEGPALGLYQMEPATYTDLIENVLKYKPFMMNRILDACEYDYFPDAERLMTDIKLATAMARVFFIRFSEPLPKAGNVQGMEN